MASQHPRKQEEESDIESDIEFKDFYLRFCQSTFTFFMYQIEMYLFMCVTSGILSSESGFHGSTDVTLLDEIRCLNKDEGCQ